MPSVDQLRIKLFCDGADFDSITSMYKDPAFAGFSTNPTLMKKVGITDYEAFGRKVLAAVPDRPVSLEIFADDVETMESQADKIATWGSNVNVKIPVTNTRGEFSGVLLKKLSEFQADEIGCHIITATPDIFAKLKIVDKDLDEYSLDTIKMFFNDATAASFSI